MNRIEALKNEFINLDGTAAHHLHIDNKKEFDY